MIILLIIISSIVSFFIHRRNRRLLMKVTSPRRGTRSERRLVLKMLKKGVEPEAIYHDLYLQMRNGEYTQVDIVVVMPQGLLAIEVKDYGGWLFGREDQRYWTQVLGHGREKHRFYNPIMQNSGHIRALRGQSGQLSGLPVYNIVLFGNRCRLKDISWSPDNAYVGYTRDIMRVLKKIRHLSPAGYTDRAEISDILTRAVLNGEDQEIVSGHIGYVKRRSRRGRIRHFFRWLF